MGYELKHQNCPELPRLSWLAVIRHNVIEVYHGDGVECSERGIVEGVWDGTFGEWNFHESENFFGSGIRLVGDAVHLVPSSAMVDRILYCKRGSEILASNSLVVLLGASGASLNPEHDYHHEFLSICRGLNGYNSKFVVSHPEIESFEQVFYENVVIEDGRIGRRIRSRRHEIQSYEQYHSLLKDILNRIRDNYEDRDRAAPLTPYASISSGYDSTAVSCLVRGLGVQDCFTARRSNSWMPWSDKYSRDDGTNTATRLGYKVQYMYDKDIDESEIYFLSTNCGRNLGVSYETRFIGLAQHIRKKSETAVVFTGYHGDKVWDVDLTGRFLVDDIVRGDSSGLNLAEIRLVSGFINVPVPFIMARSIRDLHRISTSEEMKPWRMFNDYDRPIPRRIIETAGIDRNSFASIKKAITISYRYPRNRALRKRFFSYCKKNYGVHPTTMYLSDYLNKMVMIARKMAKKVGYPSRNYQKPLFWADMDSSFLMWLWATACLAEKLRTYFAARGILQGSSESR